MKTENQPNQPVVVPAPAPQPVAPPVVQPQAQPVQQGPGLFAEYFAKVKSIFMNPNSVQDAAPSPIKESVIFVAMNLGVMSVVTLIVSMITNATSSYADFSGEFFGSLFKYMFLSILFTTIFLSAIAGIIYVISLIAKKEIKFSDIFSVISLFSVNCLAVSVASIIGLLMIWLTDADPVLFIYTFIGLITSLVFVYTSILIINGITKTTKFNLFISTAIYIVSSLVLVFILGRIFPDMGMYFNISFGNYSGASASTSISLDAMVNAAQDAMDKILNN